MKKLLWSFVFVSMLFQNCSVADSLDSSSTNDSANVLAVTDPVLIGYNLRWLDTPNFDTSNVVALVDSLNTQIFRYPGGTVAHQWEWKTGRTSDGGVPSNVTHLIGDVKKLADGTGAKVTFVLDVVHHSVEDQIEMLHAANVPVEYIELGNELYAPEYETVFPTGKEYADTINSWVPKLRIEFPNAKIGAVMLPRPVGAANVRGSEWNTKVNQNITAAVDAYIYHVYMSNSEGAVARLQRLNEVFVNNPNVETWVTEYGDKNQDYNEALVLADLLLAAPYNTKLLLNHCLIAKSGDFTKIVDSGNGTNYTFTPEGLAFLTKYNPYLKPFSFLETFETHTTDPDPLASAGFKSFALPTQTISSTKKIAYQNNTNSFADATNVALTSNNGLNILFNSTLTSVKQMDNVLVSPKYSFNGLGAVTFQIDTAYLQSLTNNTATITYYWSTTHDGSETFNPANWNVIGTETAVQMANQGFAVGKFKRESFTITPSTDFYIAVRIQQTLDPASSAKTQWRFDNIRVFK